MGIVDDIRSAFDGDDSNDSDVVDKAQSLVNDHPDQVDAVVDRGGDLVDERTGERFTAQVDQGQDFVRDHTRDL